MKTTITKKQLLCLMMTLMFVFTAAIPVLASGVNKISFANPQKVTLKIDDIHGEDTGIRITVDKAYEKYAADDVVWEVDSNGTGSGTIGAKTIYVTSDATITINVDMECYGKGTVEFLAKANEPIRIDQYGGDFEAALKKKMLQVHDGQSIMIPAETQSMIFIAQDYYEENAVLKPISELVASGSVTVVTETSQIASEQPKPTQATTLIAKPTASPVHVNGKNIAFDAYNIEGNNYFKLRDLAYVLNGTQKQFEVGWDSAKNAISLSSGTAYTVAGGELTGKGAGNKVPVPTSSKIYLDGKEVSFTAYNIEGNNYFKLRDIGEAFDFGVTWDSSINTIVIDTNAGYTQS